MTETTRSSRQAGVACSVILPNCNHAAYIGRALNALLAQEVGPDEIIVIDDASHDTSMAILQDYAAKHPRIRLVVNRENRGVIPVLQQGLEIARGDYVYFGAADDWVMPGFFSLALDFLGAYQQAGLFCADAVAIDGITEEFKGYRP